MTSTVPNTDVRQKDADHAVVIAIAASALFPADDSSKDHGVGVAFSLLQALQRVNEYLLEENPAELLLFDIILITTDRRQQQQSGRLVDSTTHHGLEVSRLCFSSEEDFVDSLLKNKVQLFLTTDRQEASKASQSGVLTALLDQQTALSPPEQLRILFCDDDNDMAAQSQGAVQRFLSQLSDMRQRFSMSDSPLSFTLLTSRSDRQSCISALKKLRCRGVRVDEAFCLAGCARGPILSVLRPHFLLSGCLEE